MQDMTPEERFKRVENFLATVAESQAKQAGEIEKNNAAIRDLIVISRTLIDSHKRAEVETDKLRESIAELRKSIAELRAEFRNRQQDTDEKLHILVETVDRIIRNLNK
jgi:hypothetical protein